MTVEQKAKQAVNSIINSLSFEIDFEENNYDAGYAHALHNHGEAIYLAGYNETSRWIPFEEEKPFINDYILVRTNLYPLVKPRVKRVTSRVDLSKKYSHWKAI